MNIESSREMVCCFHHLIAVKTKTEREYGSFDKDCEKIGKPSIEGGWVEYCVFVEKKSDEIVDFGEMSYSKICNIQLIKNQQQIQILSNMLNNE